MFLKLKLNLKKCWLFGFGVVYSALRISVVLPLAAGRLNGIRETVFDGKAGPDAKNALTCLPLENRLSALPYGDKGS
jgi:hypothetical protein